MDPTSAPTSRARGLVNRLRGYGTRIRPYPGTTEQLTRLQKVWKFMESPTFGNVGAFLFFAIGLIIMNGPYMKIACASLAIAWLMVAVRLWGQPPFIYVSLLAIIGASMVLLTYYMHPDAVPLNFGRLTPEAELIFSPNGPYPRLEIGDSGVFFQNANNDKSGNSIFPYLARDQIKIELIAGKYKFSTRVTDENGGIIAELIRNDWKVYPGAWDRNYNDQMLEVKDSRGDIVLQINALPDRVQFQGIWWTKQSPWAPERARICIYSMAIAALRQMRPVRIGSQVMIQHIRQDDQADCLVPWFVYPSDLHLGELVK